MQTSKFALYAAMGSAIGTTASLAQAETTDAWQLLEEIKIKEIMTETTYEVQKTFPEQMEERGEGILISGYAFPMLPGETISELILVSDMGLCPLCGNGDHGANLQIKLAEPITNFDESIRITLRGNIKAVTDPETWQAAVMEDAQIIVQG
ncbi:hypothetical protein [Cognatishimia sp.]|uniref:hypothetical protein n=1 Tax=Cognatishimia sp. TaxID=2211648 RepID=UPI003515A7F3